jgi:menaquinone-dependent protoporphyrinogen IX oxidase
VAEAIGEVIGEEGGVVKVASVSEIFDVIGYDAVVLGSSIRAGKWLPEAFEFLETHRELLSHRPVAYFTTCLTMADDNEDSRRKVLAYMEPVRQKAPEIKLVGLGLFAGSLDPTRPLAMSVAGPQGDYRDWETIRAWARQIRPALLAGEAGVETEPVVLREAVLAFTDLSGTDLSGADLTGSNLQQAKLSEIDLHSAELNWADLKRSDASRADLHQANLIGADLRRANLYQANLQQAILNGADLGHADLREADLSYSDLNWADLRGADLREANLSGANLGWANLSRANLAGANLSNTRYNLETTWPAEFSPEEYQAILVSGEPH